MTCPTDITPTTMDGSTKSLQETCPPLDEQCHCQDIVITIGELVEDLIHAETDLTPTITYILQVVSKLVRTLHADRAWGNICPLEMYSVPGGDSTLDVPEAPTTLGHREPEEEFNLI